MTPAEHSVELTAEGLSKLDASPRRGATHFVRLGHPGRGRDAETVLGSAGGVVGSLPHAAPYDASLCLNCQLEKILSSVP